MSDKHLTPGNGKLKTLLLHLTDRLIYPLFDAPVSHKFRPFLPFQFVSLGRIEVCENVKNVSFHTLGCLKTS